MSEQAFADLLIKNAVLKTFDDSQSGKNADALAIAGNKILAIGKQTDLARLVKPATRIIDANGHTVLPGFVESHMHLFGGAFELSCLHLGEVRGREHLRRATTHYAKDNPELEMVYAVGADYEMLGPKHPLDRHVLDDILPDRPFAMMAADHHTVWANSLALKRAGLFEGMEDCLAGEVVMGADGFATGVLLEPDAFGAVLALTAQGGRDLLGYITGQDPHPEPGAKERESDKAVIVRGLLHCAEHGITSIHNMDGNHYQLSLLEEIAQEGNLHCRVQVPFHLKPGMPLEKLAEATAFRQRFSGDKVNSGRVKMFIDGVAESGTAWMLEDYPGQPGHRGHALFDPEKFRDACIAIDKLGLQMSTHAIGDAAVRAALDGYEAAANANGKRDSRHRIEHVETLHPDDLPRFAQLGVIAAMQPLHSPRCGLWPVPETGDVWHDHQRPTCFASRTLMEDGVVVPFATDWPVAPVDVMPSVKGAVVGTDAGPVFGDQSVSLNQALQAYTTSGAWAEFAEHKKGVLKEGMLADVVIMSHDLDTLSPAHLDQAQAAITICDGIVTWQKPESAKGP